MAKDIHDTTETPFEAKNIALHFRLKAIEDQVEKLPELVAVRLFDKLPNKEDCDKKHEAIEKRFSENDHFPVPWKRIFAGIGAIVFGILSYFFGAPANSQEPQIKSGVSTSSTTQANTGPNK